MVVRRDRFVRDASYVCTSGLYIVNIYKYLYEYSVRHAYKHSYEFPMKNKLMKVFVMRRPHNLQSYLTCMSCRGQLLRYGKIYRKMSVSLKLYLQGCISLM